MKRPRKGRDQAATANALPFVLGGYNMDNIVNVISSVGFPIAMALLLFWYMTKQNESHKEETASLKDAINKLEVAITALVTKIGKE